MARLGKIISFLLTLILNYSGLALAATPSVKMQVDHSSISLSETATLSIIIKNALDTEYPNLTGGDDFEISIIGPETRIEVINGSVSQDVTYRYRLMPKKIGLLKSPSATVRVGGEVFAFSPIDIRVDKGADLESGDVERIANFAIQKFSDSDIYVGQQVVYDLTTFTSDDPIEFKPENFGFDGFWSEELGKLDKSVTKIRGKNFHTVKSRQALFPLSSGEITIPLRRVTMKVKERQTRKHSPLSDMFGFDPFGDTFFDTAFMGIGERNLQAPEIKLKVTPLPPRPKITGAVAPNADVVGPTSIRMNGNEGTLKYGDSVSLTVIIQSEGNLNPVTSLNIDPSLGFRVYEDPSSTTKFESAGKVVTEKTFKVSLVPERAGELYLPALKLQYFDPYTKTYSVAETRGLKFTVIGGPTESEEAKNLETEQSSADSTSLSDNNVSDKETNLKEDAPRERISLQMTIFIICAFIIFVSIFYGIVRILRKRGSIASLRQSILAAQDTNSFSKCLTNVVEKHIGIKVVGLSNEALKAEIRGRVSDKDLSFLLQNLLDELDMIRFGGAQSIELNKLKDKLLQII